MDIANYFQLAINRGASDLHLVSGSAPSLRINGDLFKLSHDLIDPKELETAIYGLIEEKVRERFERKRDLDFSRYFFGARFRVNLHFQEGQVALSARLISNEIPRPDQIGFDETIYRFTHLKDGLIIVTGPSGSGKSTSLACMINLINHERRAHIITIEDPIEYVFKDDQSIIEQREVGLDTVSFASGLKYALRQDPNVIMVGEMRDLETVRAAITAAETGHLVISTLHTSSSPEAIARMVDLFPAHQQSQIFIQLSSVLRAVITQQLIPKKKGGLLAVREILVNNRAAANLIRRNQLEQMYSVIQTGQKEGMITMNKAIEQLLGAGLITEGTAKRCQRDVDTWAVYY